MPNRGQRSNLAHEACQLATLARRLGGVAVVVVAGLALFGKPVQAQLPILPPFTTTPPDTATTTSSTSTTLLPPLVPSADLIPPPHDNADPPPSILPLPTTTPARRTTTYKPPPIPPSTPARTGSPAKARTHPTTTAKPTPSGTGEQLEEADPGFGAELPFAPQEAESPATDKTMELGAEASAREQIGSLASLAAGLIAIVLFGVVRWLRNEIRRAPVPPT